MKDTIFVPSFGNRPENLIGRDDVLRLFDECLKSRPGSRERAQLILGQRGYGKTVLLLQLAEMAKSKGYIVASPTVVSKDMPERIIEKLKSSGEDLFKKKSKIAGGNVSAFGFGAGLQIRDESGEKKSFAQQLMDLCRLFNEKDHKVLILVDEVQPNSEALRQLIISYQEMVGEGIDVAMVLAGLPASVSSVLNDHVLTFLNRATKIILSPLRTNEIEIYYKKSFKELGLSIESDAIADAASATVGSPYLMQLIGHYLTVSADDKGVLNKKDYSQALKHAVKDFKNDICLTTLATLSDRDIDFLIAMSKDENESSISSVTKRMKISNAYAQNYKRRLIQAGVIEPAGRGKMIFSVPYLKEHLQEQ